MPHFGDEVGLMWDEPPVIKPETRGGKRSDFDGNAKPKPDYRPPDEYRPFKHLQRIGLDLETKDPNIKTKGGGARRRSIEPGSRIVGAAIAYAINDATYYPTAHCNTDRCVADPDKFYGQLREEAETFEGEIVGANLQYDLDWLDAEQGIRFPKAKFRDVQVAEPLLDENRMTFKLDVLSRDYLGEGKYTETLKEVYGSDYISHMDVVDPGWAAEYAERDTTAPWEILDQQLPALEEQGLTALYEMESDLTPLLLQMRRVGVRVDLDACERAYEMTKQEAVNAAAAIKDRVGFTVDVWSSDSIARAFDKEGVPYPKTTQGRPSFRKEWLAACPFPVAQMIIEQRTFEKIGGTFLRNYILEGSVDGRIHAMFNQLKSDEGGTVSGRFSSSGPNLQNIPVRHPILGPLCRSIFIPEEDHDWGSVDWSQIEYRFLVHYADITPGIDADAAVRMYRDDPNTDFHDLAAQLFGIPRKQAKNINFGVVYGMGVDKLALDLGLPRHEAEILLNTAHERSPFMKAMLNTASNQATKNQMIKTILGRRRRFDQWEIGGHLYGSRDAALEAQRASNGKIRGYPRVAKTHKALNALLQGSAADLMKMAMVKMSKDGIFDVLVPHLTVHDEMNVSVPRTAIAKEAWHEMQHIMENTLKLKVPVIAAANLGSNWDEAK